MAKTVLILGGSYAGLTVAHKLLKNTLPTEKDLKVILVSKTTHFYWNMASVRAVVPGILTDDQLFAPIEPGFAQYPKGSVEFIVGAATGINATSKTAQVSTSTGAREVAYDYLLVATGARSADVGMPWKSDGSHEENLATLHGVADRVKAASHIVVAGAGATGIELSGELGFEFKDKTIILLSAGKDIANGDSSAGALERELVKLGVQIRKGVRAEGTETTADGKTLVKLAGGETISTDLYLPTTGLVPNSEFLPQEWLTENKYADVDDQMRVKAAKDTWAYGDVVSKPRASFVNTDAHAAGVAKNIEAALKDKDQQVVKGLPFDIFVCATGRGRGAGRMGYVPMLSLMAWAAKGRTLAIERLPKYASGNL